MLRASLVAALLVASTTAFMFDLSAGTYRCFTEELPGDTESNVTYAALPGYGQLLDVKITDPMSSIIYHEKSVDRGDFLIHTTTGGEYAVCLYSRMVGGVRSSGAELSRRIKFMWHTGVDNVNYQKVASSEHMKPMEMHLKIIEDGVRALHTDYEYFKEREHEMRDTNEHLNSKVSVLTIGAMVIFCIFAYLQSAHLKRFFRRKRMID